MPKRTTEAKRSKPAPQSGDLHVATTTELVALAKRRLPEAVWEFIVGGAETETTALRNRHALDAIAFRPRVLRNVEGATPATTFLGIPQRMPILLAPLASATDIDPEGVLPIARAAGRLGCPMLLSSVAGADIAAAARAAGEQFMFQLYADGDDRWLLDAAKQAVDLGCKALCLTADVPAFGRRERSIHRRHAIAGRPFGGLRTGEANRARADWQVVERLKKLPVPLIVKGIATAEDASIAIKHGVDAIYVSNHGGRQLDHGRAGIEMLVEVVSAARGKAEVVVDGGFMRGTDVVKAVAMGARMVGLGKLQALALGAAGETGVVKLLELIETELVVTMKLLGVASCAQLDGTYLQPASAVTPPGPLSAFPLLAEMGSDPVSDGGGRTPMGSDPVSARPGGAAKKQRRR